MDMDVDVDVGMDAHGRTARGRMHETHCSERAPVTSISTWHCGTYWIGTCSCGALSCHGGTPCRSSVERYRVNAPNGRAGGDGGEEGGVRAPGDAAEPAAAAAAAAWAALARSSLEVPARRPRCGERAGMSKKGATFLTSTACSGALGDGRIIASGEAPKTGSSPLA